MSINLSVETSEKNIEILDILSSRTGRAKSELIDEALSYLFEEYKEIIVG